MMKKLLFIFCILVAATGAMAQTDSTYTIIDSSDYDFPPGYAGGIVSAAMDGERCADMIAISMHK
jgi:hypothetical protein